MNDGPLMWALKGLPHREPFVFVDRLIELEPGVRAVGERTFPADAPVFAGHFPGNPIVPGVLLTEALAQLAGILGAAGSDNAQFLLSAIRGMKFPSPAGPGELIRLEAKCGAVMGGLHQFEVSAIVAGSVVASGQVILNKTVQNCA